jgi:hypothetical protein
VLAGHRDDGGVAHAGWARISFSTSKEEMFSPRRRIASFRRSTK